VRRKESESWYIVFSGIEDPHTSMTVHTRLARTAVVTEFSQSEFYRTDTGGGGTDPESHHVLQNSHLDGFQLVFDQFADTIYSITSSDIPSFSAVKAHSEAISYRSIQSANAA
jgi:hypothetical protein